MKFVRKALTTLGFFAAVAAGASAVQANTQTGIASWYKMGKVTANGEAYNPDGLTAAHRTLPFGTIVEVKNLGNGRTVRLRINDRGPFIGGRIIDVSRGGARRLGLMGSGTARVRVTQLGRGGFTARSYGVRTEFSCIFEECH
ncbi:MAG TPA: septal ring lytic transglycosylase RlpA family protein [Rhizobiales bacterium]|nr:RlpA-like protein precursor [bacterium BMS3Bbin10]HDO52903.1 septal ring lytic transglycosylase RlpA family protein [Hyphomicrobiales bacterium]